MTVRLIATPWRYVYSASNDRFMDREVWILPALMCTASSAPRHSISDDLIYLALCLAAKQSIQCNQYLLNLGR